VFYIRLFDVKVTEDDMKKNETCRSISGYMWKCTFNACVFVGIIHWIGPEML